MFYVTVNIISAILEFCYLYRRVFITAGLEEEMFFRS